MNKKKKTLQLIKHIWKKKQKREENKLEKKQKKNIETYRYVTKLISFTAEHFYVFNADIYAEAVWLMAYLVLFKNVPETNLRWFIVNTQE